MFQTNDNNYLKYHHTPTPEEIERRIHRKKTIHERLWTVHDAYIEDPTRRFKASGGDVLIEHNCENGRGLMSENRIPDAMLTFVQQMLAKFRVTPGKFSTEDVIYELMYHLDFTEPYWLFVDSAVVLCNNGEHLEKTFKLKETGRTLEPDRLELFRINRGWDFAPYAKVMEFIQNPLVQQVLDGYNVVNPTTNRTVIREDILEKVVNGVWGNLQNLYYFCEEILERRYDDEIYHKVNSAEEAEDAAIDYQQELKHYVHAVAAGLLWLRSPMAVSFLIYAHPIYNTLLRWSEEKNCPIEDPKSGGLAIVTGWEVYTKNQVEIVDAPAGTCESCGQTVHCTKFVNINALRSDPCTCGHITDPQDTELYMHSAHCPSRAKAKFAYMCQKCMYELSFGTQTPKCGRTTCPNTGCSWHVGANARIRALTEKRKLMLTGPGA